MSHFKNCGDAKNKKSSPSLTVVVWLGVSIGTGHEEFLFS